MMKRFKFRSSSSLLGAPGDVMAGKRADLEKAMNKVCWLSNLSPFQSWICIQDVLDQEIAQRPQPEELVQKGILNRAWFSSRPQSHPCRRTGASDLGGNMNMYCDMLANWRYYSFWGSYASIDFVQTG